jgi:5-methyltetrahydropteroyltriglutamate--homocysteine methyltransferase
MNTLVDDVGSFPLPAQIDRGLFDKAYIQARQAISSGKDIRNDKFLLSNFAEVTIDSFRKKLATGLDVVTYPQHYDMYMQVTDLIYKAMDEGTYVVDERNAILPEVYVIDAEAKELCELIGKRIPLRVCIAGPLELYLKVVGTVFYRDILLMFAETVRRFAKNSILNSKYVKTEVVSLDEPSFGFQDISASRDAISDVLERAFDFSDATKQIHLHSSVRVADIIDVKNLDVLSCEFGASPRNIEAVSKKILDDADKLIRVGIARTDIDAMNAELHDKGIVKPDAEQMVENEEIIQKRFAKARDKYGDRLAFTGPDCGLGGWPTQESAQLLLKRTVNAVKNA